MKKNLIYLAIVSIIILGCNNDEAETKKTIEKTINKENTIKDVRCAKCNGTGKLSESYEERLNFENQKPLIKDNSSLFSSSYKYSFKILIKNTDTETGEFLLIVSWLYPGNGSEDIKKLEVIQPGNSKEFVINYKTDTKVKNANYKIVSPKIIRTKESICTECNGAGISPR